MQADPLGEESVKIEPLCRPPEDNFYSHIVQKNIGKNYGHTKTIFEKDK